MIELYKSKMWLTNKEMRIFKLSQRVMELEAEVRDVRQRLIGGVEGTLAASTVTSKMMAWAEANDRWLRETAPQIANYHNPEQ